MLRERRRVVIFAYGAETQAEPLIERALADVDADRFDVLGFSIGGWFAQCLAARAPKRVRKLVLANSFTLEPADSWRFGLARFVWPFVPAALFRAAVGKRAKAALEPLRTARSEAYDEALSSVAAALAAPGARAKRAAQQEAIRDSLRNAARPVTDILIVRSDADPMVPAAAQAKLAQTYPSAKLVTITGGGHASALIHPQNFAAAVDDFLEEKHRPTAIKPRRNGRLTST